MLFVADRSSPFNGGEACPLGRLGKDEWVNRVEGRVDCFEVSNKINECVRLGIYINMIKPFFFILIQN